jgi:hypothetical protein
LLRNGPLPLPPKRGRGTDRHYAAFGSAAVASAISA